MYDIVQAADLRCSLRAVALRKICIQFVGHLDVDFKTIGNAPELRPATRPRVELTRALLIRSAEKIFARDGFEAARLEEIAADAGYTRGAFYANFENKEDLFFALIEDGISSRIAKVQSEMDRVEGPEAKLTALRAFLWICAWIGAGVCWPLSSSCSRSAIPRSRPDWR